MASLRARGIVIAVACSLARASAGEANATGNNCCYSGPTDCDGPRDWCSSSEAHCTNCGGRFSSATVNATDANATHVADRANATLLVLDLGNSSGWQKYVPEKYRQYANHHHGGEADEHSRHNYSNWEKFVPAEYRKKAEEGEQKEKEREANETNATKNGGNSTINASDALLLSSGASTSQNNSNWKKYVPQEDQKYTKYQHGNATEKYGNWEKYVPKEYRKKAEEDEQKQKEQEEKEKETYENRSNKTVNASDALLLSSESANSQNKSKWEAYVPKEYQHYTKHQRDGASSEAQNNSNWEKYVPKMDRKYAQHREGNASDNLSKWEKYVPKAYRKKAEEDEQKEKEQKEKGEETRENQSNATSPTMLYGAHCNRVTGGTCKYIRCSSSRGPTSCISGKCLCKPGYHNAGGKCLMGCGAEAALLLADREDEPAAEFLAAKRQDSRAEVSAEFAAILTAGLILLAISRVWYGRRINLPAAPLG